MPSRSRFSYRGKQISNPYLAALIVGAMILVLVLKILLFVALMIIATPFLIVIHFTLKVFGRGGFVTENSPDALTIEVSKASFQKARQQ